MRISVGDIFRWHIRNHTKLAAKVHRFIDSGRLVPDEIVEEVVKARLDQHDWNYGFVLDGYPASELQAEFFLESYDVDGVILIDVSDDLAVERLQTLNTCKSCGLDYNLIHHHQQRDRVCDVCGGELGNQDAGSPAAAGERISEYHSKTKPIIEVFRRRGLVVKVDGTISPEALQDQIRVELGLTSEAMAQRLRGVTELQESGNGKHSDLPVGD